MPELSASWLELAMLANESMDFYQSEKEWLYLLVKLLIIFFLTVHLIACIFLQDPLSTGRILFSVIARPFKKVTS